jgi:peptidylprolyl isomerase
MATFQLSPFGVGNLAQRCSGRKVYITAHSFSLVTSQSTRGSGLSHSPKKASLPMTEVKSGDTVRIHYTGTLKDGTTFDSSSGRDPLEFTVGSGQIIPGLDVALPGMSVGDKKKVDIECKDAYGPINPEMRQTVPREGIPDEIPLDLGTRLQMQTPDGQAVPVTVVEVSDSDVTLDANPPLAGQDLTFDIELVEIA